jgi:transposase-like protein
MEKDLQSVQFVLPRLAKEGVNRIYINVDGTAEYMYKAIKKKANG